LGHFDRGGRLTIFLGAPNEIRAKIFNEIALETFLPGSTKLPNKTS